MKGIFYIICGSSASGKTTLVSRILSKDSNFVKATKYSTRKNRPGDIADDIIHVDKINPGEFDLCWAAMENHYGIKFAEINNLLEKGKNVLLSTTNLRAVSRIKSQYNDQVTSLSIFSPIDQSKLYEVVADRTDYEPKEDIKKQFSILFSMLNAASELKRWRDVYSKTRELLEIWQKSIPDAQGVEQRIRKIRDFYIKFIESGNEFDYTILNYRMNHIEDMINQFYVIHNSNSKDLKVYKYKHSGPKIFVVASSSGGGKRLLVENLSIIAPNEIEISPKWGKRDTKPNDGKDGMIAIGKKGSFPNHADIKYLMHKSKYYEGTEYAFSSKEIDKRLQAGKHQLLVANVLQSENLWHQLIKMYKEKLVILYLFRFEDQELMRTYQYSNCKTEEEATSRLEEIKQTYLSYAKHIDKVDHVIFNTDFPDDMYDQVLKLFEQYGLVRN